MTLTSRRLAILVSGGLGLAALVGLVATVTQIGCQPVTSPLDVVPLTIAPALVAGSSYFSSYAVADRIQRRGGALAALALSAAVWIAFLFATVLVSFLAFPVASCALPQ